MKATTIFYIGLALDLLLLATCVSNTLLSLPYLQSTNSSNTSGFSPGGNLALWLIPLVITALVVTAFFMKKAGNMLPANILVWIPALPMLLGLVVCGGLAVLFIAFGK